MKLLKIRIYMKKYPRIVQSDKRGQIVIPKEIRQELGLDEGSAFWVYSVGDEGILLKKVDEKPVEESKEVSEISEKADKIGVSKKKISDTKERYKKSRRGKLKEI
ncbi:AbrB/MazE/SpoVT family DNA-binding domain-containing protein [Nanoarchaeota archaeon]